MDHGTGRSLPESAYSRLVHDRLVRLAYRFLWNREDAEDAAQDALVTAYGREHELRDTDKWWNWICRILVHRCHEHGRRKLRRQRLEPAIYGDALRRIEDRGTNGFPDEPGWLAALIEELPRRQREVIVLRHLEGMDFSEIAEVLGMKPATARVHAQAGRETLRKLILKRHPGWLQGPGVDPGKTR